MQAGQAGQGGGAGRAGRRGCRCSVPARGLLLGSVRACGAAGATLRGSHPAAPSPHAMPRLLPLWARGATQCYPVLPSASQC
jgi:hypothetical protein